jgi:hypothetical protein
MLNLQSIFNIENIFLKHGYNRKVAGWQSGHAAACKAVYAGSIPASASKKIYTLCPGGGIGRHKGLKIPRRQLRAGSSPALGTNVIFKKMYNIN